MRTVRQAGLLPVHPCARRDGGGGLRRGRARLSRPRQWRRNFGLHTLAFGVADADAARADAARHGLPVGPVLEWARRVEEEDIAAEARFAFFVAEYDPKDDSFLCWVRHLTPAAIRSPRLTRHANGARSLAAALIATESDPAPLIARYVACGGVALGHTVRFAGGEVGILTRADLPDALAQARWPAESWFAALRIGLDDPSRFADRARQAGLPVAPWHDGLVVDLMAPLGCAIVAVAAGP
ncbi:VOC family protein [Leptolyngbya sp. 15MV]|nr:VOC family protein [Leptolyngbya sp. 15MV]